MLLVVWIFSYLLSGLIVTFAFTRDVPPRPQPVITHMTSFLLKSSMAVGLPMRVGHTGESNCISLTSETKESGYSPGHFSNALIISAVLPTFSSF
jgi:hypothetical protein